MKVLKALSEALHKVSNVFCWVSAACLFFISAFIFVDVFARYVFNNPITGSQEIVELVIVCVLYLGLPYSTYKRSHVRVDALTSKFPEPVKDVVLGIMNLLCVILVAAITWQLYRQTGKIIARGTASSILKIPHWPFYIVAVIGNFFLTFEFLCDGIRYFYEAATCKKEKPAEIGEEVEV